MPFHLQPSSRNSIGFSILKDQDGFTVVELLISVGIVGILLTGIYNFFVSSSKNYLAQNGIIQMQSDARAAMDFMVRELQLVYGTPIISTMVASNDTISFDRVEDTGYASGGSSMTLTDATKALVWQPNAFAPSTDSSYTVRTIRGTGAGQSRTISANTATQLTITPAWGTTPDITSVYVITSNKGFTRTSATDKVLRYRIGATGQNNPLTDNITALSFAQPDLTTISITLTARTQNIDPRTKNYRSYTLNETVRKRN
jgi:prepilin-type N-terminal cleavage/methylation domain-containing protein